MKKFILYTILLLAAVSCVKESEYNRTLGLLSEYNSLPNSGGSTQVAVFSNTDWTVSMEPKVSWASIDRLGGHKSGHLVFDYEINYGRARRTLLVFKAGNETMTLNMYQEGGISDEDCVMDLQVEDDKIEATAEGLVMEIPFETNLVYNLNEMFLTLTYPVDQEPVQDWITLKSVEATKVTIEIAPNNTGEERRANVKLSHTDAGSLKSTEGDTIYSNTLTVVQTL